MSRRLLVNFLFGVDLQAVRKKYDPSGYKLPTALKVRAVAHRAKNNRALPLCISRLFHLLFTIYRLGAGRVWIALQFRHFYFNPIINHSFLPRPDSRLSFFSRPVHQFPHRAIMDDSMMDDSVFGDEASGSDFAPEPAPVGIACNAPTYRLSLLTRRVSRNPKLKRRPRKLPRSLPPRRLPRQNLTSSLLPRRRLKPTVRATLISKCRIMIRSPKHPPKRRRQPPPSARPQSLSRMLRMSLTAEILQPKTEASRAMPQTSIRK